MRLFLFILAFAVLAGCARLDLSARSGEQTIKSNNPILYTPRLSQEQLTTGSLVKISDPNFSKDIQAIVGQSYYSALGQQCYRINVQNPDLSRLTVLCRDKSENWAIVLPINSPLDRAK